MSSPGVKPARSIASIRTVIASSFESRFGANPPSSPTAVDSPRAPITDLRTWYVSVPQRSASERLGAPIGDDHELWKSIELSAWTPPLITFIIGTGRTWALGPPTYWYSGMSSSIAAALAIARLVPRIAFAPKRALLSVPSRVDHGLIGQALVERVVAEQFIRDLVVDEADCGENALAAEASPPSRSSTASCSPGRCPGWDCRPSFSARIEEDIYLDRWVAAAVENLAPGDADDLTHTRETYLICCRKSPAIGER